MARRCPSCGTSFPDAVFFCGNDGTITIQEQSADDYDPRLGDLIDEYVVVAHVADGAMGRVYEGRHRQTKARTAIKVLHADVVRDAVAVERFKREYETAASFDHPNIVKVIAFGRTADRSYFMVMEYLEGEELGKLLRREKVQPPERMIRVAAQTALALDYAHSFGVIHRDLKPDNLFLCRSPDGDVVKVLDFGSVKLQMETGPKLTAFGTTLGSPYYMSPEQAMGRADVDQRSDVFALAAIAYEMVTGRVAFEGGSVAEILMRIMNDSPAPASQVRPGLPAAFDDAVEKGLRKDKDRRYATASQLAAAIVAAFGLEGPVDAWAGTSVAEIAQRLAAARPPAPKPFGASVAPPAAGAAAPAPPQPGPASAPASTPRAPSLAVGGGAISEAPRSRSSSPVLLLAFALVGLLMLGGAAAVAALFFMH